MSIYLAEVEENGQKWVFGVFSTCKNIKKALSEVEMGHLLTDSADTSAVKISRWELDEHSVVLSEDTENANNSA